MTMKLIVNRIKKYHVAFDTVKEFEKAILSDPSVEKVKQANKIFLRLSVLLWKLWNKLSELLKIKLKSGFSKTFLRNKQLFIVLMGTNFSQSLPYFASKANKSIYLFDAWPATHDRIERFVRLFGVNNIFFTSRQTTEIFANKLNGTNCFWVPEGINPEDYKYCSYADKEIDVLALGRKHDVYHGQIVDYLRENGKVYL